MRHLHPVDRYAIPGIYLMLFAAIYFTQLMPSAPGAGKVIFRDGQVFLLIVAMIAVLFLLASRFAAIDLRKAASMFDGSVRSYTELRRIYLATTTIVLLTAFAGISLVTLFVAK